MSTTLQLESFAVNNIQERTTLNEGVAPGATSLQVASTEGFEAGKIIYVGQLSREGCEKAVVAALPDAMTITLSAPLELPHGRFEPVTAVVGDLIRIYYAPNIDGKVPPIENFTVLATRSIDPDNSGNATYYAHSDESSECWYRSDYFNAATGDSTDLADSRAIRGDDFGHYASITEIRVGAGLENALNLEDYAVGQERRNAEAEINVALGSVQTTPFVPVPEIIHTLTIQLAAGLLLESEYGEGSTRASGKLKSARALIKSLQDRDQSINDENGVSLGGGGISSWPGEDQPRAFFMGDRF